MTFTSLLFAVFVGVTLIVYYVMPNKRFQWVVLLTAGFFFYLYNSHIYVSFIIITTITVYCAGRMIEKISLNYLHKIESSENECDKEKRKLLKLKAQKKKCSILIITLFINFGILFFLKYARLISVGVVYLLSQKHHDGQIFSTILPLGISFYTFQATGYLIDVYRGTVHAEKNYFRFALFVSFFPQIIQGPISEYEKLQHQLVEEHKLCLENIKHGCMLILWGLFKKLVIADRMFASINTITTAYTDYSGEMIVLAVLMYSIQLYADFSGGIDIARGVSELFGIRLEQNFRQPYFSRSISEYWRRWHITLGVWMKKYVFYTLAVSGLFSRVSRKISRSKFGHTKAGTHISRALPSALASLIVFVLIGIWHGANSRYIGFGLWNGVVVMMSTLMNPIYKYATEKLHIESEGVPWKIFQTVRTFVIVLVGYYFDVAPNLTSAIDMMRRSVADFKLLLHAELINTLGLSGTDLIILSCGILIMLYFSVRLERTGLETPGDLLNKRSLHIRWVAVFICILSILTFGVYGSGMQGTDFVYMGF